MKEPGYLKRHHFSIIIAAAVIIIIIALNACSQKENNDINEQLPFTYPNVSDSTSLLHVRPQSSLGKYVRKVWMNDSDYTKTGKYILIEGIVLDDYYRNCAKDDTIYIAFPYSFFVSSDNEGVLSIDPDNLEKAIIDCDSFLFWTGNLYNQDYLYKNDHNEARSFDNFCYCFFYEHGIIPFMNQKVDFELINSLLKKSKIDRKIDDYFFNIRNSGISIIQGEHILDAINSVEELIDKKVYGGNYERMY